MRTHPLSLALCGGAALLWFVAALPAEHAKLLKATAANTEAIKDLTVQVMHLSQIEEVRANGETPPPG